MLDSVSCFIEVHSWRRLRGTSACGTWKSHFRPEARSPGHCVFRLISAARPRCTCEQGKRPMKSILRMLFVGRSPHAGSTTDPTVEWKTSLQVSSTARWFTHRRRCHSRVAQGRGTLRSSIDSFAAANPNLKVTTPGHCLRRDQRGSLACAGAADRGCQSGRPSESRDSVQSREVQVNVTADLAESSPVTVGIDQSQIATRT